MKLVAPVRLIPPDGGKALLATLTTMNEAAQWVADVAREERIWGKRALHKRCYLEMRTRFGIGAQAAIRALYKAANSYKDKSSRKTRQFVDPHGAVAFDDRNLAWQLDADKVRIWTTRGRQLIPFVCGPVQRKMLAQRKGESDLVYRGGEWFLFATIDVPEPTPYLAVPEILGVDLGIVNVAATSDGKELGKHVAPTRARYVATRG